MYTSGPSPILQIIRDSFSSCRMPTEFCSGSRIPALMRITASANSYASLCQNYPVYSLSFWLWERRPHFWRQSIAFRPTLSWATSCALLAVDIPDS